MRGQRSPSFTASTSASACVSAASRAWADSASVARSRAAARARVRRGAQPAGLPGRLGAQAGRFLLGRPAQAGGGLLAGGAQALRLQGGGGAGAAGLLQRGGARLLGLFQRRAGDRQRRLGLAQLGLRRHQGGGIDQQRLHFGPLGRQAGPLLGQPVHPRLGRPQRLGQGAVTGGEVGGVFGGAVGVRLGGADRIGSGDSGVVGARHARRMGGILTVQPRRLGVQPLDRRRGIAACLLGMGEVAGDLIQPGGGGLHGGAGAGLLGGDLLAGDLVALQRGAGGALRRAQGGQGGGGLGGGGGRAGGFGGGGGDLRLGAMQRRLGGGAGNHDLGPLDRQQLGLGGADQPRYGPVPVGLTGLALQAFELAFELPLQVVRAAEICLGGASFSSASWRRACRPVMPAASSRMARRSSGLALTMAPTRPWLTSPDERAPVARSANSVCTSRARASRPLMR